MTFENAPHYRQSESRAVAALVFLGRSRKSVPDIFLLLLAYAVAVVEHVEARAAARLLLTTMIISLSLPQYLTALLIKLKKHLLYFVSVGVYPQPLFDVAAEIVAAVVKVELFDDAFHQLGKNRSPSC